MKIKRWMILATVFVVLAGSIVASGCQPSNTASTSNKDDIVHEELCSDMCYNMRSDCSVAGKSYNCNSPEGRSDYFDACMSNCEYNGKTYDCTTLLGCASFWSTIGCEMCMQVCEGADDNGNN